MTNRGTSGEGPLTASVEKLRHELDRWLDYAVARGGKAMEAIGLSGQAHAPEADVAETDEDVLVLLNLPGIDSETLDVSLAGNMLTVAGRYADPLAAGNVEKHRCERPRGEFQRAIPLPASVNPEAVEAETTDGVLTVRLRKTEQSRSRTIPVRSATKSAD